MKKLKLKSLILGLAAVCTMVFATGARPVHAASSGMSVSPMSQKLVLAPGDSYSGTITVYNSSDSGAVLNFRAFADSFFVDDSYSVTLGTENDFTAMKNWIKIGQETGTVEAGKSVEVPYTINVPRDAIAGGQYAAIVIASVPGGSEGGVAIQEVWQIASTIYASISGSSTLSGDIKTNSVPSLILNPPLETTTTVENTGNVHGEAISYLQVFPLFSDEEVYSNEEKDTTTALVLPGTTRMLTNTWKDAPALGLFRVRQTVNAFGSSSVTEKVVLICPLWFIIVIIALVGTCIFWLISRAIRRKKSNEE